MIDDTDTGELGLLEFASSVYEMRQWAMTPVHTRVLDWLESTHREPVRVLRCWRGMGKSSLLAIYASWRYLRNQRHQIYVMSADDSLAIDLARDTISIMESHPLLSGSVRQPPAVHSWFTVDGYASNARVPAMRARGVLSRMTGARCDEAILDDPEVPANVASADGRRKLRKRLAELTHVQKVGGSKLYVGTPHAVDSIYDEAIRAGAVHMTIPLFRSHTRYESANQVRYAVGFPVAVDELHVFCGIGAHARALIHGRDFSIDGGFIQFAEPPGGLLDIYGRCEWPERFDRAELMKRRRETRTVGEWDSQYMLIARPFEQIRLDPNWIVPYESEPVIKTANASCAMFLDGAQIVSACCRVDPASGKIGSDVSAVALVLQDSRGRYYWHRSLALTGEISSVNDRGEVSGGQLEQIADLVEKYQLPCVEVETNGIGMTVPSLLRAVLRRRGLAVGVRERHSSTNKERRILAGLEPVMRSGALSAHVSVLAQVTEQLRDWSPAGSNQQDDHIDAASAAILSEPTRLGKVIAGQSQQSRERFGTWLPATGVHEVTFEDRVGALMAGRGDDEPEPNPRMFRL